MIFSLTFFYSECHFSLMLRVEVGEDELSFLVEVSPQPSDRLVGGVLSFFGLDSDMLLRYGHPLLRIFVVYLSFLFLCIGKMCLACSAISRTSCPHFLVLQRYIY